MPEKPSATVTFGSLGAHGAGSRAAATDTVQAVAHGIEAGVRSATREGGHADIARLRVRLPPGASPNAMSRALEDAVVRALRRRP
jgi:hypothetical protein